MAKETQNSCRWVGPVFLGVCLKKPKIQALILGFFGDGGNREPKMGSTDRLRRTYETFFSHTSSSSSRSSRILIGIFATTRLSDDVASSDHS
jgi:hypothetical protein